MTIAASKYLTLETTSLFVRSADFARIEDDFYGALKTANGSFKTTQHQRLDAVNDAFFTALERCGLKPAVIMDVGVSSGVTTLEWMDEFARRGIAVKTIVTDRTLHAYLVRLAPHLTLLIDPSGHILQVELMGMAIRPWCSRRDYLSGMFLLRNAVVAWARRALGHLALHFPLDAARAAAKADRVTGPFLLLTPPLRGRPDVTCVEDDILAPNPPALTGIADAIRLANIVQRVYFSDDEIARIICNVRARCRDGALVVVCRNHPDSVEGSILRAIPGGGFALEARIGPGSEVERAFCAL